MTKVELGPFSVEGGMKLIGEFDTDEFYRDFVIYANGFCKALQIQYAIDNDMNSKSVRFWNQRVSDVSVLVKDIGTEGDAVLHELKVSIVVNFESDDHEMLLPIEESAAAEMLRASLYSFLAHYEILYGQGQN